MLHLLTPAVLPTHLTMATQLKVRRRNKLKVSQLLAFVFIDEKN